MDMIAIDVGNSTVSIGVFANDEPVRSEQVPLEEIQKLGGIIRAMRDRCGPQPLGAKTVPVVVSSVNQKALVLVEAAVGDTLDQRILLMGRDVPLEMKTAVENTEALGQDRLMTAFAAYQVIGAAVAVASFGTATTIDLVNDHGIFLGGMILPGLGLSALSLHEHTDALPQVQIRVPDQLYGTNTESAIRSGIYYAALGSLREIIERYATELGHWPHVIATGGYARLIAQKCDFIDSLVPDLCLDGIYLAYRRFREAQEPTTP